MASTDPDAEALAEPKDYGKRGFLTAEQVRNQKEFLERCDKEALEMARYTSEDPQDTALRFLRSRKFLVEKAMDLLNESKALRLSCKTKEAAAMTPNEAAGCDVDVMKTFYPHSMVGHTYNNLPIVWEATGKINIQAVMTVMNRDLLLSYHFWNMETCLDMKFTECADLPAPPADVGGSPSGKVRAGGGAGERGRRDSPGKVGGGGGNSADVAAPIADSSVSAANPPLPPVPSSSSSSSSANTTAEADTTVTATESAGTTDDSASNAAIATSSPQYSPYDIATFAVLDLSGFGLAQSGQKTLDQLKLYINTDNTCYPETLSKMLLINAPYVLSAVWGIVKGWLDPRTVNKIEIISSTEASLRRLRDFIPIDQLPAEYGGNAPPLYVPKPNCDFIWIGRSGEHSAEVCVPAGSSVTIDSYVLDGAIEYSVESRRLPTDAEKEAEKVRREADSKSRWFSAKEESSPFAALAYQPTVTHTTQFTINPVEAGVQRTRHVQTLCPADFKAGGSGQGVQLRVTWKNTSRMSQRSIVYALTVTKG
jgi:hypothetical protein